MGTCACVCCSLFFVGVFLLSCFILQYIQDIQTGMSKRYGFVEMQQRSDIEKVLEERNHVIQNNKVSHVRTHVGVAYCYYVSD